MKSMLLIVLTLCVIDLIRAEDDGKYRAERWSNDGRYFSNYNGRYDQSGYRDFYGNDYYRRGNDYYGGYQPYPYNNLRPAHELVAPFAGFGKSNSANENSVLQSKPTEAAKLGPLKIVVPTTALPKILPPSTTSIPTTALPRVHYAKLANEGSARIVSQDSDVEDHGYNYSFRTENGINIGESGLVDEANSGGGTRVKGFYEYVGDDGLVYRVDYTADENGFRATGAHLP